MLLLEAEVTSNNSIDESTEIIVERPLGYVAWVGRGDWVGGYIHKQSDNN